MVDREHDSQVKKLLNSLLRNRAIATRVSLAIFTASSLYAMYYIDDTFKKIVFNIINAADNAPFIAACLIAVVSSFLAVWLSFDGDKIKQSVSLADAEALSSAERNVASTADTLARDFEQRARIAVDSAVSSWADKADNLIKYELSSKIDELFGNNIVESIGKILAEQSDDITKINQIRRDSGDRFLQMRNRSLEYASLAERQARVFRGSGMNLAIIGLLVLGFVLAGTYYQYWKSPELLQQHVEWEVVLLRHGPTYAFVILCEVLALIMFRYQSKALELMRYFSNEATNIDARHTAFLSALQFMDKQKLSKLIERLDATERNFLIDKHQRTLEMANNENEDRMIERIRTLLDRSKGEKQEAVKKKKDDGEE
ncbi:hypothetical protein [Methylosinus sp. sav-2]|jgi:hypothetical protein|uniref:hypothetical protein n=2 Tax=unclassified Methylosinus TaxID=2624500 RepID=UPI0010668754|nr:hypothetical protein [Methylosinus sp. sav-2]